MNIIIHSITKMENHTVTNLKRVPMVSQKPDKPFQYQGPIQQYYHHELVHQVGF